MLLLYEFSLGRGLPGEVFMQKGLVLNMVAVNQNEYGIRNYRMVFSIKHALYLTALAVYLIYVFLQTTMFYTIIPSDLYLLVRIIAAVLICLKVIAYDGYTKKQLILSGIFMASIIISWRVSDYSNIVDIAMLILGAKNVPLKRIVKIYFVVGLSLLIITIISAKLGIIQNLVYYQGTRIRNSFGAIYPTDFAAHVFYLALSYWYIKGRRLKIIEYITFLLLAVFLLIYCDARLDAFSMILTILAGILFSLKKSKNLGRVMRFFLSFSVPICAVVFIGITVAYSTSNKLLVQLNTLLSYRLSLGKSGIEQYGFSLFGQQIKMNGWGGLTGFNQGFTKYFFIDSSYLRIALLYGSILLIFLCVVFVFFCRSRIKNGDILLPIIIALIAINSMVAHHLIDVAYNPFILSFLAKYNDAS